MRISFLPLLPLFVSLCACGVGEGRRLPLMKEAPRIDADLAFSFAEKNASIVPRHAGSPGAKQSADWIASEAGKLRRFRTERMEFDDLTPSGKLRFCNIIATLPGKSSEHILVAAHYDTKKFQLFPFEGVNDGASGVGALLAMMTALDGAEGVPPFTIHFVFFDGEECLLEYGKHDGLHGSRRLASVWKKNGSLAQCRAMILLDMIGDRDLNVTIPENSDALLTRLTLEEAGKLGYGAHFSRSGLSILDDHVPFLEQGVPSINLIDFEYGPGNRYWHTRADTLDKISGSSMKTAADTALALIWRLAEEQKPRHP